jgi:hypothetical protein
MYRFDTVAHSSLCITLDAVPAALSDAAQALLTRCTLPIVLHDFTHAAVLGCGTLVQHQQRIGLLTAAHLFDTAGLCVGNLLVPAYTAGSHGALISLAQARVLQDPQADVALIDLTHAQHRAQICQGRTCIDLPSCSSAESSPASSPHVLCGYPAQWSRFERGWLAARRLTVRTHPRAATPDLLEFSTCAHDAQDPHGRTLHTPAMEGMSGASVWRIVHTGDNAHLLLAGVQSAFRHSQYLRLASTRSLMQLL